MLLLPPPKSNYILLSKPPISSQLWPEWAHPLLLGASWCLYIPMGKLHNRDYVNTSNIIEALTISMLLLIPFKSCNIDLSKPVSSQLWSQWAHTLLLGANQFLCIPIMRLHNRDYLNTSNIIADLTISMLLIIPTTSQHVDLSKPWLKRVMVCMGSSTPAGCKLMSMYTHCESAQQILPQYIKYYSSFDHFHPSTHTPNNMPTYWPIKTPAQASCGLNGLIHFCWMQINVSVYPLWGYTIKITSIHQIL